MTAHEYHEKRTTPNFQVLSYQPEHVSPLRRTREAIEDLIKFSSEIHICRSLMCFTVPLKKPRRHNRTLVSSRKSLSALFSDVWPVQNGNSEKKHRAKAPIDMNDVFPHLNINRTNFQPRDGKELRIDSTDFQQRQGTPILLRPEA